MNLEEIKSAIGIEPYHEEEAGVIYCGDCLEILPKMPNNSVDVVFADPPFNLQKNYGYSFDDKLTEKDYRRWTGFWLKAITCKITEGGQIWVHQIPKHAIHTAHKLEEVSWPVGMVFQNWVAVKFESWVNQYNLNPFHYVMLRYSKGKVTTFNRKGDLSPHQYCRHCGGLIADWGGKEKYRNEEGKCLSDIWDDIERIRHTKNKTRDCNELPIKLVERCIKLTTNEGDLVLDPFLGSGTTAVACKELNRKFIGIEINEEYCEIARNRLRQNVLNFRK